MPTKVKFSEQVEVVELVGAIRMANVRLSSHGSLYAIARAIGTVAQDPQDDFAMVDVATRSARTPTVRQILNCQDWNSEAADACAKAVIANGQNVDLLLKDLAISTEYIVYYVAANEYPTEPVFSGEINSFTVQVLSGARNTVGFVLMLSLILTMFL